MGKRNRRRERDKQWQEAAQQSQEARKDMLARIDPSIRTDYTTYTGNHAHSTDYYNHKNDLTITNNTKTGYSTEPPLRDQVNMLVAEVAKLSVLVDKQETDLKAYEEEKSEWWKLIESLKMRVEHMEADLDLQIDALHQELADAFDDYEG